MIVGIVLMVVSVFFFVISMTAILPKLLLRVKSTVTEPEGRGIKKALFNGRRCIVYRSGSEVHKYIKQYLIYDEGNQKVLRCKTNGSLRYIDYDIVLFNKYDKAFKVINVKEDIVKGDLTRRVDLPKETSYVSIVIRKADSQDFAKPPVFNVTVKSIAIYSIACFLVTLLETFILKVSCAFAFGGVFRESFIQSPSSTIVGLLLSLLTGLLALISIIYSVKIKGKH
jgi:hypothetical protein